MVYEQTSGKLEIKCFLKPLLPSVPRHASSYFGYLATPFGKKHYFREISNNIVLSILDDSNHDMIVTFFVYLLFLFIFLAFSAGVQFCEA